ncbi:hypothetical protein ACTFIW_005443 [Dictyostelium discoideum]
MNFKFNLKRKKSNAKKSVNSSGNNTTGNSSNSKSSNGRSNNFNGSPSNVASVCRELCLPNFCQEDVNGLKVYLLPNFEPMSNPIPISIPDGPKSDCYLMQQYQVCKRFQQPFSEEQEVNLPVGGRLFHHKQVWKELGLPKFCQEVVNGLKVHILPNFKPMPNPVPFSIPEGPKSDCITKEVQDLFLDD